MPTVTICRFRWNLILFFPLIFGSITLSSAQAQTLKLAQAATPSQLDNATPPEDLRPLNQSSSLLSLKGGQRLMNEAKQAIDAEKYPLAITKLEQARKVFDQLYNFHLQLANSFSGIDNRIVDEQKKDALQTVLMRDEASYQLALVHRAQNQPELAVPLLLQIISFQTPTSDLGKKSYQQLYELGFVSTPYPPTTPQ
jgi:hypothetical protein